MTVLDPPAMKPGTDTPPPGRVTSSEAGDGLAFVIPPTASTFHGFRAWAQSDAFPERGRISFLDNEIYIDMSPERLNSHVSLKRQITYALTQYELETGNGVPMADGMLVSNETANISNEPDAMYVKFSTIEAGRVTLGPTAAGDDIGEVLGSPDLVVETISPSSVTKDKVKLLTGYFRAGIPEYWLIDARRDVLDFQLFVAGPADYEAVIPTAESWRYSPVLDREVRITKTGVWGKVLRWAVDTRKRQPSP